MRINLFCIEFSFIIIVVCDKIVYSPYRIMLFWHRNYCFCYVITYYCVLFYHFLKYCNTACYRVIKSRFKPKNNNTIPRLVMLLVKLTKNLEKIVVSEGMECFGFRLTRAIFVLSKNRLDVRHYSWIAIIIIPISWF